MARPLPRNEDGSLAAYAWPGAYPIFYCDREDNVLCVTCAQQADAQGERLTPAINWGAADESCAQCSAVLESAYADDMEDTSW